jgi:protein-disulfide isomerase
MELRLMKFVGPDSDRLARAIEAAGLQNRMWNAADLVYFNQGEENSGYADESFVRRVLGAVPGLDVERALAERNHLRVSRALGATDALARQYGISSTPSFVIGPTGGTLSKASLRTLSAEEIGRAIDAVAKR